MLRRERPTILLRYVCLQRRWRIYAFYFFFFFSQLACPTLWQVPGFTGQEANVLYFPGRSRPDVLRPDFVGM